MKHYFIPCFLICILFLLPACQSSLMTDPSRLPQGDIVYEIYVQSFCDSNDDGIGDLPGLISKLDYIQELGATAIWIMPIHPSPSYHKYDVSDYYAIHPDFGTMDDMDRLIEEVHQRKLKIILDLVINHTSSDHMWFTASSSSPDNPFRQYYVWKDFETVKDEIQKKTTTFDSDNLTQWHEWHGQEDRYYGFFWKGMPDLNFDHPPLREEVYKIGRFWLDKGIDGFRLDAAKHIYPDDRLDDTRKFWEEFTEKMRAINPDVKIIGEVWSDPQILATLFKGLPSLFNFELTKSIPECIHGSDAHRFISSYNHISATYQSSGIPFEDAILLSNHDMNRIRSTLGGDIEKSKLAASILLSLPGTPYIYYGEEIGMLGIKPDIHIREMFLWDVTTLQKPLWQASKYSTPPDVVPLSIQKEDPSSFYHHYKKWIKWRIQYPALSFGQLQFIETGNNSILAYILSDASATLMAIHNLGAKEVNITIPKPGKRIETEMKEKVTTTILITGYESILLVLDQ